MVMPNRHQQPRGTRVEAINTIGRFRGGKLAPVSAHWVSGSEGGSMRQRISAMLDPIAGRMLSPIQFEVVSVFVPMQAMHELAFNSDPYPGSADAVRAKLLSGDQMFSMETEHEISKRCGIQPKSWDDNPRVNSSVRFAHNAAVNYLRKRKYVNAAHLFGNNTSITPAIISQTVLDRLNAVLDPEDRVDGHVDLSGQIPVKGIGTEDDLGGWMDSPPEVNESDGTSRTYAKARATWSEINTRVFLEEDPDNARHPYLRVDFDGAGQSLSLRDFYRAEIMDKLTREMRVYVDKYPEYGEELVARWAAGLSLDVGKQPFVLYERSVIMGARPYMAMDGPNLGDRITEHLAEHSFTVPVPRTEFGGVIMTFATVRPDEVIPAQPHPFFGSPVVAENYAADELALDPVPLYKLDINADVPMAEQADIIGYVGNNHLKKAYAHHGFNRHLDPLDVADKTAIWQLEIPYSVSPSNILYPEDLDHYPFVDQLAEVCTYSVESALVMKTPIVFGPTPVEELQAIETEDIFEDG